MIETLHYNGKVHKCDKCGLPTIKRYKVLAPSLNEKDGTLCLCDRTLWLCGLCFKTLSGTVELEETD